MQITFTLGLSSLAGLVFAFPRAGGATCMPLTSSVWNPAHFFGLVASTRYKRPENSSSHKRRTHQRSSLSSTNRRGKRSLYVQTEARCHQKCLESFRRKDPTMEK